MVILLCCISSALNASEMLTFELKNGKTHVFALEDNPNISFSTGKIIIKSLSAETSYAIGDVSKYYFLDIETDIKQVNNDFIFSFIDNVLSISGCRNIQIYSISGNLIFSEDNIEETQISMKDYPKGVYMIKTDLKTIKIIKR